MAEILTEGSKIKLNNMNQKKYSRMWVEENHNCYDLLSIVRNYGPKMVWGISAKDAIAYAKDFHAEFYLNEAELKDFAEKGYDFYVLNNGLRQLLARLEKDIPAVNIAIHRLIKLNLRDLDNAQLFQEYLDYARPYDDLMASYIITQPHFIIKIEQELKRDLSILPNSEELFTSLTGSSVKFTFSQKGGFFQKSFAELLGSEDAQLDMTILDAPLFEERILDTTKQEALIKANFLPDNLVKFGEILSKIAETRLRMRFVWMPAIYFLELFLIELKRRYNIPKTTIRKYDTDEFNELIRVGQIVDKAILKERSMGFAKVLSGGEIKTLAGDEAVSFIVNINKVDEKIKEIKGTIASKGFAKGKVIILSYTKSSEHAEKIKNMTDGDILVSEMTRPNIIVACEKAGAIVTDEGGITCHAAIVSRELKKPCIIGTKIATKILKDGDVIEVDANVGVVRILKDTP